MKLPKEVSESQFLEIVDNIASKLCDRFKFGYYDRDDIKQECYILAMDAIQRYDTSRPLPNFLWSHIYKRLCTLKRDKYFRLEKPCDKCPLDAYVKNTDMCTAFEHKTDCKPYARWYDNNSNKQNIMNPIGISYVNDEQEQNMRDNHQVVSNVSNNEIFEIIERAISLSMRKYWLQQKAGIKISKKNYDLLMDEINVILEEHNIDVSQTW